MQRLIIPLDREERQALSQLAIVERREPRWQAVLIIRQKLEELGLISPKMLVQAAQEPEGNQS